MSSSNSPCAACKFLRRKCTQGCVFAPYFPPDQPQKFANVHRVFGASNVAKLLNDQNPAQREDAVNSLAYEAEARIHDPVYGCVAYIQILQQRLKQIQTDLYSAKKELSTYIGPAALSPLLPTHHSPFGMAAVSFHQQQYGMNVGLGLTPATNQQILLREQQQQIEAQQLAAVAAREQEMLRSFEAQQQQQSEINARFGNNGGFVDGRVFNNNSMSAVQVTSAGTGGASPPSGLALVPSQQFDSGSFHIQQQQQHQAQQQQIQIHHHYAEQHLQMQQQHQQRSGSDEGRIGSIGPTS